MHVTWSRIDAGNMRVIEPGLYKNKLKEISRELEQELGLSDEGLQRAIAGGQNARGRAQ